MGRLMPGENEKIDKINDLVKVARGNDKAESNRALDALLSLFKPMILKICNKWSQYFQDNSHTIIQWDVLVNDANYWFIYYTTDKYTPDGAATYNKFMKDHLDQRIRYIYETELKYIDHMVFPNPNKNSVQNGDCECMDALEEVINKYSRHDVSDMDIGLIEREDLNNRKMVLQAIMDMMNNNNFTDRERLIFTQCMIYGKTHESMSGELSISRTRVSQIVAKIRSKISDNLDDTIRGWEGML